MNKLFIDINVLLDVLLNREPHYKASQRILVLIESKKAIGYVSAVSFPTIHYLLQKEGFKKEALAYIKSLMKLLLVVEVDRETLEKSLMIESKDFEDCIQMACAEACQAKYIITRDATDFKNSPVPVISPAEYIATFVS